ncbi:LysE family translocator [Sodalis sp.]|uniref:LysE family translocator n=1 Tax=Sodalis sp. (in: enterobacteria) TaxID=1898979 RepID=UPI003872ECDF
MLRASSGERMLLLEFIAQLLELAHRRTGYFTERRRGLRDEQAARGASLAAKNGLCCATGAFMLVLSSVWREHGMLLTSSLLLFSAACLALTLTPGPDMLLIASRSLSQGRGAGFATLGGIMAGTYCHALAAAFGLSQLFLAAQLAYQLVRGAGAVYLLYLAWKYSGVAKVRRRWRSPAAGRWGRYSVRA